MRKARPAPLGIAKMDGSCKECGKPRGYQGWSNYETWAVKLWIDNEESTYRHWASAAQEAIDEHGTRDEWKARLGSGTAGRSGPSELANRLKEEIGAEAPECEGLFGDLMSAALGEVNWYEIAEALCEGLEREVEEEVEAE